MPRGRKYRIGAGPQDRKYRRTKRIKRSHIPPPQTLTPFPLFIMAVIMMIIIIIIIIIDKNSVLQVKSVKEEMSDLSSPSEDAADAGRCEISSPAVPLKVRRMSYTGPGQQKHVLLWMSSCCPLSAYAELVLLRTRL